MEYISWVVPASLSLSCTAFVLSRIFIAVLSRLLLNVPCDMASTLSLWETFMAY